jgi:tripartite-type tricarboxylate transporter receptor subunit TctC
VRAVAVTTASRSSSLPDVPTIAETVPGYEVVGWSGIGAPRNTPADIVDLLNREINAGLASPKLKDRFADLGATVMPLSPAYFAVLIADDVAMRSKVIKFPDLQAD